MIKEINLSKEAFNDLVLPKNYRTLIKSLVDRVSLSSFLGDPGVDLLVVREVSFLNGAC